jgi:hypothetical protein
LQRKTTTKLHQNWMKNKNVHILEICPFWTCSVKFISGTVRNSGNWDIENIAIYFKKGSEMEPKFLNIWKVAIFSSNIDGIIFFELINWLCWIFSQLCGLISTIYIQKNRKHYFWHIGTFCLKTDKDKIPPINPNLHATYHFLQYITKSTGRHFKQMSY